MGSDDHLLGGVRALVQMRCSLSPSRMTGVDFESASIERNEVIYLMQFMDRNAQLLREIEVVRRDLVLRVVAAPDLAVAAGDASSAPGPDSAEIRIFGFDARAAEVHTDWRLIEGSPSAHFSGDLPHIPIDVGGQVWIANDTKHPPCLVIARCQLVGPIGDCRPSRCVEELPRRDI